MWSPTHVLVTVQKAKGLLTKGKNKTNDCFVIIALGKEKYQTSVKEKASENVEWHEECELQIPQHGNTAEVVLTALHRNFMGLDEFLGTVSIPLSSFDVYERPKNRWYALNSKPGKENTKERGELEVKISFHVKAGSLTDLTRKERHKSSLGQLTTAAQSFGGSLLSIGSFEKRKGLKSLAKNFGNKVKGKSKNKLDENHLDEIDEHAFRPKSKQEPGEADPGVISEDEDEFTFDDLSHKSSASSLNGPTVTHSSANQSKNPFFTNSGNDNSYSTNVQQPVTNAKGPPSKPPRFVGSINSTKVENAPEDEWGQKLYGVQGAPKRGMGCVQYQYASSFWMGYLALIIIYFVFLPVVCVRSYVFFCFSTYRWDKSNPKIIIDEAKEERENSPTASPRPSPISRLRESSEPPSPALREVPKEQDKIIREDKVQHVEKSPKEDKHQNTKSPKEDKHHVKNIKEEKFGKKDKKKDNRLSMLNEHRPSTERIIIGGEDRYTNKDKNGPKGRLPHELLRQFEGKSREDLIESVVQLQYEVADKKKRLHDLEDYIDSLLLRVIESSPRLLQNPYSPQRRLSSPGNQ